MKSAAVLAAKHHANKAPANDFLYISEWYKCLLLIQQAIPIRI